MIQFFQECLFYFRGCFSRTATFQWFIVVMTGFVSRSDHFGVSSIIRGLLLTPKCYERLLHFFHSKAWDIDTLLNKWWHLVVKSGTPVQVNDKLILLADHTKVSKEGRKMPGVSSLRQDSETSSKPSFFRGHFWGTISILTGKTGTHFSTPLWSSIHQKLRLQGYTDPEETSTERIANMAKTITDVIKKDAYLLLDSFFVSGYVFGIAGTSKNDNPGITVITPAKSNTVGYELIARKKRPQKRRGAPKKYGKPIKVATKFNRYARRFTNGSAEVYGRREVIRYYSQVLYWKPVKGNLLFVWAETSRGKIVLICSDVDESPINVVELYCKRAKIETMFSTLKNIFGGHQYHFWSMYQESQSRQPKKNNKDVKTSDIEKTMETFEAIHRFFNLQSIVIGLMQMLSVKFPETVVSESHLWLRTPSNNEPSEMLAKTAMKNIISRYSIKLSKMHMIQIIRAKQNYGESDENWREAA